MGVCLFKFLKQALRDLARLGSTTTAMEIGKDIPKKDAHKRVEMWPNLGRRHRDGISREIDRTAEGFAEAIAYAGKPIRDAHADECGIGLGLLPHVIKEEIALLFRVSRAGKRSGRCRIVRHGIGGQDQAGAPFGLSHLCTDHDGKEVTELVSSKVLTPCHISRLIFVGMRKLEHEPQQDLIQRLERGAT
jgi:hypothetical protein